MSLPNDISMLLVTTKAFLGTLLFTAGALKTIQQDAFLNTVHAYRLVPAKWATVVGRNLPRAEIVIGLALTAGFQPVGAWLRSALGIFAIFSGVVAIKLIQGDRSIACGCFGPEGQHISWWIFMRNVVLSLIALLTYEFSRALAMPNAPSHREIDTVCAACSGIALVAAPLFTVKVVRPLWDIDAAIAKMWDQEKADAK
jgi:hypothetical protein